MRDEAENQLRFSIPGTLQEALRKSEIIHRAVEMENKEKNLKIHIFSFRTKKKKKEMFQLWENGSHETRL
jgi:hypothetical protein